MFDAVQYLKEHNNSTKRKHSYDAQYALKQASKYEQTNEPTGTFATNFITEPETLNLVANDPKLYHKLWNYFETRHEKELQYQSL